ncbi:MAG: class I mannose-6-phosphate isomerase [Ruminococcus sp.]|nr:class I mannose-6-phosphate isomerase [Ruminococcus sp.]
MREPIFLKGVCKDYLWGGQKLRELFGKESDSEILAESWELSCHPDGCSVVMNGADKGLTLTEYIEKHGAENILGAHCGRMENVPLIKLIDAKEPLSVQVHPDDAYARTHGDANGKTEMWYVLDAEEGAELVYGVNRELTREEFRAHIEDGTLEEILNYVPVKKGDVFFIPAGTLHAIGGGILIAEVQQNSNLTYRVYDYNRRDAEGKLRELHVEDAIQVTNLVPTVAEQSCCNMADMETPWGRSRILCACDYFVAVQEWVDHRVVRAGSENVYHHFLILEGEGVLETGGNVYPLKKGDSVLLPPIKGDYCIDGRLSYLSTFSLDAEEIENKIMEE